MNPINITATTLPDAWYQVLYALVDKGRIFKIDKGSYAGQRRLELDFIMIHIKYPWIEPLLPFIPEHLNIAPPCDQEYLNSYCSYIMTSEKGVGESYTYGSRLCSISIVDKMWNGDYRKNMLEVFDIIKDGNISQIDFLIKKYKKEGHRTNQLLLRITEPQDMFLDDPPCWLIGDTRIQDNKLHFFITFRSWDAYNGFPANLAAIEILNQYMAGEIGVDPGEIIATSKGLHLYDYVWSIAETLSNRKIMQGC